MNVRELQHLAAAMAHEVRNPLNSMAIHVELMEGRLRKLASEMGSETEAALRSVGVLQNEISRIDKILEEYLEHAGAIESARRLVSSEQVISAAVDRVKEEALGRRVSFDVRFTGGPTTWSVDPDAFDDALVALLANAIQASKEGGRVEIEARTDEEHADVQVRDFGEGIAREDLPRLFQIGYSRRRRAGLGLTIAKQIVKGHGGSISVESAGPTRGATFRLRWPLESET
jgi:two-component system, sporulation sensor kinase E